MKYRILRYQFSDSKWPSTSIHSEVTTKYDLENDQLTSVSIVHNVFKESLEAEGEDEEGIILQYPFPSDVCPACSEQPVLVWSGDNIKPIENWEDHPDVDLTLDSTSRS